jgi:tetratricopeptide (TPR) repeat protein
VGRNAQVFSSTPSVQLFKDSRPSFLHAIETAPLDQLENLLPAQTKLYSGLYSNETSREQIADDILLAIKRLPVAVRLASLEELALAAFQNADKKESERWTRASSELISKAGGTAEHRIPSLARLAAVKFQTGQHKEATANLANAIALFDLERHTIIEIDRAEVLIAVAEALTTMGEADRANAIYERALTEAGINPNSRPRAEDLVAILCSMAVHSPHMSSDLREKAQALFASLGHPW